MPCSITRGRRRAACPRTGALVWVTCTTSRSSRSAAGWRISAMRPCGALCSSHTAGTSRPGRAAQPLARPALSPRGRWRTTTSTSARRQLLRRAPRPPTPASPTCGPGRARPGRGRARPGRGTCGPCTNAVVHEPWTCQMRTLTPPPPDGPSGRRARHARRPPRRPSTGARHGWPGTGQTAGAAAGAGDVLVAEQHVRARPRPPPRGRHHGREDDDHRRAHRGRQVRRTGVADDDDASAPASTSASPARSVRPAEVDHAGDAAAGDARSAPRSAAAPVTTTRRPVATSAATSSRASARRRRRGPAPRRRGARRRTARRQLGAAPAAAAGRPERRRRRRAAR